MERKRFSSGALESLLHFDRRKFCGRGCMAEAFKARPKKLNPGWMTAHYHARKAAPQRDRCERCGKKGRTDVHHRDEDWRNNLPENLERLCRSCHMKEHRQKPTCSLCEMPVKGHGFCDKHYQRWKKWGDPLAIKPNQHVPLMRSED